MKSNASRAVVEDPIAGVIERGVTPAQVLRGDAGRPAPFTMRQLLENPAILTPPPAFIPNLAWAGRVTLASAREKAGKSTLFGQGCAAYSQGGDFFGERLEAGRVLWYAIDEDASDAVRRFDHFGADPDSISIQCERPTALQMDDEIVSTGATVVVVDTLAQLLSGLVTSWRQPEELTPLLDSFARVARKRQVALVLLHHTIKAGTEYRDSTAIGAAVDVVLTLRQPSLKSEADGAEWDTVNSDDGRRLLEGKGRGNIKVKLRLAFDGSRYALGSSPMPLRSRVLLELSKDSLSGNALAAALGVKKETVLAEVRNLRAEGLTCSRGQGSKSLFELTPKGIAAIGPVPAPIPYTESREPVQMDEVEI
jgi:hypothetical protein